MDTEERAGLRGLVDGASEDELRCVLLALEGRVVDVGESPRHTPQVDVVQSSRGILFLNLVTCGSYRALGRVAIALASRC